MGENIYGGGALGIVMESTEININGGTVNNVYGAGKGFVSSALRANADVAKANQTYNISGQRVNNSYKGIVVVNGKKHIRR